MEKEIIDIATQFVDLVLKYDKWTEIKELSDDEMKVLFETVSAAGFEPKSVKLGKMVGYYLDQDGSKTGATYPINSTCPFKVVSKEDGDNCFATGWLDCAVRRVIFGIIQKRENHEQFIEVVLSEIEKSVPLKPIQLTMEGDLLEEYPPRPSGFGSFEYFVEHTCDEDNLDSCVGVHKYCQGWVDRVRATETCDALLCRGCHLRVLFPKNIKTYKELRDSLLYERVITLHEQGKIPII